MLTDEEIKQIIYDLLEWLMDYNWPVEDKVLKVLLEREDLVLSYIRYILKKDDFKTNSEKTDYEMWKIWLMVLLIPSFNIEHKKIRTRFIKFNK